MAAEPYRCPGCASLHYAGEPAEGCIFCTLDQAREAERVARLTVSTAWSDRRAVARAVAKAQDALGRVALELSMPPSDARLLQRELCAAGLAIRDARRALREGRRSHDEREKPDHPDA